MKRIRIHYAVLQETIQFAASELKKYLRMMMPDRGEIIVEYSCDPDAIVLDLLKPQPGMNPDTDDWIQIDVKDSVGVILGSNPRSILLGVYRYLQKNGCRWLRPGVDGEWIPQKECIPVQDFHQASYRHRGLCIEGAVSYQNMIDNVDWAPKVGYNAYFLEFKTPYTFFDRWYSHLDNPMRESQHVTLEDVHSRCAMLETEIKKRGLEYHAVGHAWTCEPFGIVGDGWGRSDEILPDSIKQYFALINGKRELFHGVALNTNLCYSNEQARKIVVSYCADYAQTHCQIDYLHFWLADGTNNHCECEACSQHSVADWYVKLLNELDEEFRIRGLSTKLVFLIYVDLLWAPTVETIHHPERFSLLFAPITRTYNAPYTTEPYTGELPPFHRNHLIFPKNISENIAYLRKWQEHFQGDSFAYEYYFWRDHYHDPGYYEIGKTISEDIKRLKDIGLDGRISDQTQRSFLPTGFPMYLMGQTLFDASLTFDSLADDYFSYAFGDDWYPCKAYCALLSDKFNPAYMRDHLGSSRENLSQTDIHQEAAARFLEIPELVDGFQTVIQKNRNTGIRARDRSWELMDFHGEMVKRLAKACYHSAMGNKKQAHEAWEKTMEYVWMNEDTVQGEFDGHSFFQALNHKFQL